MSLKRNSLFNLAGLILPLGLSLLTVPAYIGLIGVERYGVLAIAWLLLGYFGIFDLGMGRATIFRIAELRSGTDDERRTTFHTAIVVNICIGAVGGLILALGADLFFERGFQMPAQLRDELTTAAPLLGLSLPVATLTAVLTGALQGRERFASTNLIGILSTFLFQLVPLFIAWRHGPNMSTLLVAGIATRVATLGVFWLACQREFGWARRVQFEKAEFLALFRFGGWVTITALIAPFLTIVDRFAIGTILGAAAVTFYTVPYSIAQRIVIVPTALTNALFPRISGMQSEDEIRGLATEGALIVISLLTLPVLFGILLAAPALTLWLGATFSAQAAFPAEILLVAFWFNAMALLPFTLLQSRNRPEWVVYVLAMELPPYLLALYFGIRHFGLAGAAAAFLLRCALDYVLLSIVADRRTIPVRAVVTASLLMLMALALGRVFEPLSGSWAAGLVVLGCSAAAEAWRTASATRLLDSLRKRISGRNAAAAYLDPEP